MRWVVVGGGGADKVRLCSRSGETHDVVADGIDEEGKLSINKHYVAKGKNSGMQSRGGSRSVAKRGDL